ncbi:MAG TPA: FAD binding domain-containing protein [Burkholderiaceae bacterium]|jgi:carbon-monoxide dehydrogenase medium subunit|nr:FAD binding domain-containing protein [Burkholderiaceae bacterium]
MISKSLLIGQRSRSRIAPFHLHRPSTVDEAVQLMGEMQTTGAYMAGGLDLINRMKFGAGPENVIHLARVSEMTTMESINRTMRIGAGVTHREIAMSPAMREHFPSLATVWSTLANPRVRCKGSLGGNVMARDPGYDVAPILMALGAHVTLAAPGRDRTQVPIDAIARETGLLVSVEIPVEDRVMLRVDRSMRPIVGIALGLDHDNGFIVRVRVAISCAYAGPCVRPLELPHPLSQPELAKRAASLASAFMDGLATPLNDWQASSQYRRQMIQVLLRRLLQQKDFP